MEHTLNKYKTTQKALEKLKYVDELMQSIAGTAPIHQPEYNPADYDCLNGKLATHYRRKKKKYEDEFPDFYDSDLRKLFSTGWIGR